MRLYTELAEWYPLLTPMADYVEEAAVFRRILLDALGGHGERRWALLELGAGAGHNAHHLQDGFDLCLTDVSAEMLALAARSCPTARCVLGDMFSLRLGEQFDAVFLHDASCYVRGDRALAQVLATAAAHLRVGGVLLVAPDFVTESFAPESEDGGVDDGERSFRYFSWVNPADPDGYTVDYVFVTKLGAAPPVVHQERHVEGLFSRSQWAEALAAAGFRGIGPDRWRHSEVERDLFLFVARYDPERSTGGTD